MQPRASALGYSVSPLPRLRKALAHEEDFFNQVSDSGHYF